MREIQGKAKNLRELLKGEKYAIDYYQRDYKWEEKQIQELVADLTSEFLDDYEEGHAREEVATYGRYFLGSIIVSRKDNTNYIVDGQQRLTSLTLLLIMLRNLQSDRPDRVAIDELIFSERYGRKSFNLHVEERVPVMDALFYCQSFDATGQPESVQNMAARYRALEDFFPQELATDALPYFTDWVTENVYLVEITAYSDDDAYTIFETMNDRGLSLTPTDMLKGFVLANITDEGKRANASTVWRNRTSQLRDISRDVEPDFFKTWLRSQYAHRIRERKKGARPEDFDRIGTEFHRWARDARDQIGLHDTDSYFKFIHRDLDFYARQYLLLLEASERPITGLEHVLYPAKQGFTLQYLLMLAPLRPDDSEFVIRRKIELVAIYVDILLNRRVWNYRTIAYSTMQYAMFIVMRRIRGLDVNALAEELLRSLESEEETFASNDDLRIHQQNGWQLHLMLARLTDYIERESGMPSRYLDYVSGAGRQRYEVEHIWANHPERHTDEFASSSEFSDFRNRFGGLLLLPKSFNASYGDLPYEAKQEHYNSQNLLARSLHPLAYDHNPGFLQFIERTGLPFRPHDQFRRDDLNERQHLYRLIAERVWEPAQIARLANSLNVGSFHQSD